MPFDCPTEPERVRREAAAWRVVGYIFGGLIFALTVWLFLFATFAIF